MNNGVNELAPTVGIKAACNHLGRSRATHYRQNQPPLHGPPTPRPRSTRALPDRETERILETLNSERFCDRAPAQIWATLLDEGTYLCSVSTMYRLLRARHQLRDRRNQRRHPAHLKPELMATGPNQVWSWDITKLAGPHKWNWFHLYVILDVHSRYVIGWLVAPRETARLAEELIAACVDVENVPAGQLSIHADRGSSMTSKTVSQLLADLGILQSHSRPHTSNDNPYSESQFKTLKQSPRFPKRFASLPAARAFVDTFMEHYNHQHRHSGIGYHTPADVHTGQAGTVRAARQRILDRAYQQHPERFHKPPQAPSIPAITWINKPEETTTTI
jgi:putative transposase